MLSDDEIRRRLLAIKHSPRQMRYGRHLPSMNSVITSSGVSRTRVYRIAFGDGFTDQTREALTRVLVTSADLKRASSQSSSSH